MVRRRFAILTASGGCARIIRSAEVEPAEVTSRLARKHGLRVVRLRQRRRRFSQPRTVMAPLLARLAAVVLGRLLVRLAGAAPASALLADLRLFVARR